MSPVSRVWSPRAVSRGRLTRPQAAATPYNNINSFASFSPETDPETALGTQRWV
jgi:hypothetical protein